jgi:hypothetical protein
MTKAQFFKTSESLHLLPGLDQDDPTTVQHKDEILALVSEEDIRMVTQTYWFMIYHNPTGSWGLVNSPQSGTIEMRIRNRDSSKLERACEHVVSTILGYEKNDHNEAKQVHFSFTESIEILEPGSQHLAYVGDVLSLNTWKQAYEERNNEWQVGWIAVIIGIGLALITIPPVENTAKTFLSSGWTTWFIGTSGRLATSAFTTSAVAFLNVLLYYFDLKRHGTIKWRLR